ncbi:MAG: PT domain-containing protein [Anaerolineae bacterium]|nr:PT domain-containing protein [Anaerolineae bacterium]
MWRMFIIVCVLILAGCGGGGNTPRPSQNVVAPTATPFPTLVFEERVTFTAGFIENPFRLAIKPNDTILTRILQILRALSSASDEPFTITTPLSSLQIEDITPLQSALTSDFNIGIATDEWNGLSTIGDLVMLVQRRVAEQVVLEIYNRTSLYFEVILLDSYGEGLTALCNSERGVVTIPILDGITTLAALANECGDVSLQIAKLSDDSLTFVPVQITIQPTPEPTSDMDATVEPTADVTAEATSQPTPAPTSTPAPINLDDAVTGEVGVFFISRTLGAQSISVMQNRVLCRLNIRDFYSWFVPDLLLDNANITPLNVIDKASPRDLVNAVASDECAGGMLSVTQFEALGTGLGVDVVQRTISFPYGIVLYPLEVELGIQLRLNEILPPMAQDPQAGYALRLLIGQNALIPITPDDLTELSQLIANSGYDLSQLGR